MPRLIHVPLSPPSRSTRTRSNAAIVTATQTAPTRADRNPGTSGDAA